MAVEHRGVDVAGVAPVAFFYAHWRQLALNSETEIAEGQLLVLFTVVALSLCWVVRATSGEESYRMPAKRSVS